MKHKILFLILIAMVFVGCKDEVLPKPKAMLRLDYPNAEYAQSGPDCVYTFDKNTLSEIKESKDCSMVLDYPMMKGSIYLTYKPVQGNLDTLLVDAQKLSYEHVVKADNIVLLDKEGGMIKKLGEESRRGLIAWLKKEEGSLVPIELKDNQFVVSLELKDEEEEGGFTIVKKTKKTSYNCMPCGVEGKCGAECNNRYGALEEHDFCKTPSRSIHE